MKQLAGSIRIGWVIEYKGKPWTVVKAMHIKPGKGGAFMQVEMKAVEEGTKTNERFRTEDTVEKLMVEEKDCQFLFEDGTGLTFMDSSGIAVVLRARRRMEALAGSLVVVNIPRQAARVLETAGLGRYVNLI